MKLVENGFRLECTPENTLDVVKLDRLRNRFTSKKEVNKYKTIVMEDDKYFYITKGDKLIISNTQKEEMVKYLGSYDSIPVNYPIELVKRKDTLCPIKLSLKKGMALRDDIQEKYGEYLNTDGDRKLCRMQTGKGKTGSTIISILNMKTVNRIGVLLAPKYFLIWIDAFKKFTNIRDDEIYIIRGRESLYNINKLRTSNYKLVLFSTDTTRYLLKDYENDEEDECSPDPIDILPLLGIEYLVVDESHEDFNNIYRHVLHLNPVKLVCLSATYESFNDADIIKKFKRVLFPEEIRMTEAELDKYVNVILLQFKFNRIETLKYLIPQKKWYSHTLLESNILKNESRKTNYFDLILYGMERYYIGTGRMLILFSTVAMVKEFKSYLDKIDKYKQKNIMTMVQGDNKAVSMTADIIISTDKSAGTGVDINNLPLTINTINGGSEYATIQGMGRNRKIDGKEVYFINLWAVNIPKHEKYIKTKKRTFRDRAKSMITTFYVDKEI